MRKCVEQRLGIALLCLALAACAAAPKPASQGSGAGTPAADLPRDYREALALMEAGRYADAIAPLEKLTRSRSQDSGPYTNLGIAYARTGEAKAAIDALEQAVKANPGNAAAHNQLGILYRQAGRFDDARRAYEAALSANPTYVLAHRNLGILFDLYLQKPAQALPHYQAYAQSAGEQEPEVKIWIAELQQRLGAQ